MQLRLEGPRAAPPTLENVDAALSALESMVDRLAEAKNSLDTKAAIIPAVAAAIAGLLVGRSVPADLPWWTVVCGLAALASALVSVGLAIEVLVPRGHQFGESPEQLAASTSEADPLRFKSQLANALALAATDLVDLVNTKGERLVGSFVAGAVAAFALLVFELLGGIR